MKKRCLLALVAGILVAAQAGQTAAEKKAEAAKKDKDQLQGTWSVITVISDGQELGVDKLVGAKVIFKDNMASAKVVRLGKGNECRFKLDPTLKVKAIDFVHADGVVTPGIYDLGENKVKIAIRPPKSARPTKLESTKGSSTMLIILNRDR